ncbi:hypothetical protein MMC13_002969 [Lambiella insularis]|nr:hypothetical protein [Lambiella insularis]
MQSRIDRLEGLVLSLMTNGAHSAGPVAAARALSTSTSSGSKEFSSPRIGNDDEMVKDEGGEEDGESETDRVVQSLGVLHVHSGKSLYVGEAHWAAILNDIAEVRNYFTEHKKQFEDQWRKVEAHKNLSGVYTGPAFLFGGRSVPPLSELLASLPGKDAVDKMVTRYFNDYDATIHIFHPPSWRRMVGMIVRLAMRMGFHRDPKFYPNLTPFQGEMRRRVWTYVRQSDLLFSSQLGLPSMIRLGDCDTELPRNLFDDEFDEDTKILPPSRPLSTATTVSYMIAKASLVFTFGKIVESLHAVRSSPYEEIMKLDQEYRDAYANISPHLRLESLEDSFLDPITTLMKRFQLSILYNKGQCVLHRIFLSRARENPRYAHSRRVCVDSSMQLLSHQATLHYESRPGRRLHSMKWYISSLTTHDFLLAATLVCLDLWYTAEAEILSQRSGDFQVWGSERRADMIRAIEVSRDIWYELRDQSMEAFKACEMLGVMLQKLQAMHTQATTIKSPGPYNFHDGHPQFTPPEEDKPEHSAALTLGMLSNGGVTPNQGHGFNPNFPLTPGTNNQQADIFPRGLSPFPMDYSAMGIASAPSPFSFLTNGNGPMDKPPANLDWDAWDSYIQNNPLDPNNDLWPSAMEVPPIGSEGQDPQQSNTNIIYNSLGGVFMGSSTSPGNTPM